MAPEDRSTDQQNHFSSLADHYGRLLAGGVILDGEAALKLVPTSGMA